MNESVVIEFLRNGTLGKLYLGMPLDDAIQYLGIPDYFDVRRQKFDKQQLRRVEHPTVGEISGLNYGCIELIFERTNDTLISIKIELSDRFPRKIPQILGTEWLSTIDGINSDRLLELLNNHHIDWFQEDHCPSELLCFRIKTSCVGITIDLEKGQNQLYSLIKDTWNWQGCIHSDEL